MTHDPHRRSFFILRALEWDDPRAKYPNLWSGGLPASVLAFDTIARRLRIGDLIAVYHPASTKHPRRAERFVGLVRVAALRRADEPSRYWLDLAPAHRFRTPLDLGAAPRRVFLCCDPGWPGPEVALFRRVYRAAVEEGWEPAPEESLDPPPRSPGADVSDETATPSRERAAHPGPTAPPASAAEPRSADDPAPLGPDARTVAGLSWSGDRRDPRDATWLCVLARDDDGRLRVVRLDATGRQGAQARLRDSGRDLIHVEAIGCAFPFGHPAAFVERLTGGRYPEDGWWGVARSFERLGYADYLMKLQEFRDEHGDLMRATDERAGTSSPMSRSPRDLASRAFHGIRTIAEDRSRFAVRPFESAEGRRLLEVDPRAAVRDVTASASSAATLAALEAAVELPVVVDAPFRARCEGSPAALEAVCAARGAARAMVTGEADRTPEDLAPEAPDRVRREGWIYGVAATG